MAASHARSIVNLPLHERRNIAVVSEDELRTLKKGEKEAEPASSVLPALGLLGSAIIPAGWVVRSGIALASFAYGALASGTRTANNLEVKKDSRRTLRPKKGVVTFLSLREANEFSFLAGCAEVGQVYAANPVSNHIYYQFDTYNDDMIEHKLSELERLLHSLGAKQYNISFNDYETTEALAKAEVKRGIGGSLEAGIMKNRKRRFERSGTSEGKEPSLPAGLLWYGQEPAWQALAESRLHHGRKEFSLSVELEIGLKLSAKAVADVQSLKMGFGAQHSSTSSLTLSVTGRF